MVVHETLSRRSVGSDLRAMGAVAGKELTIARRYPSFLIAVLVWPVLLPLAYILGAKALAGPHGGSLPAFEATTGTTDYVGFIVIGTLLWGWLNMTLWDVGFFIRNEQMRGTLESNWLCPVPRGSILVGATLMKLAVSLLFLAISFVEFRLFLGVDLLQGNVALTLLIIALLMPSIYGLGVAFASLVIRFKEANSMVFLVRGVFMIFAGMTFPIAVLPGWMQTVAMMLPLTYAIAAMRAVVLNGAGLADIRGDLLALAAFGLALPIVGYLAFAQMARRARRHGDLGQY